MSRHDKERDERQCRPDALHAHLRRNGLRPGGRLERFLGVGKFELKNRAAEKSVALFVGVSLFLYIITLFYLASYFVFINLYNFIASKYISFVSFIF